MRNILFPLETQILEESSDVDYKNCPETMLWFWLPIVVLAWLEKFEFSKQQATGLGFIPFFMKIPPQTQCERNKGIGVRQVET